MAEFGEIWQDLTKFGWMAEFGWIWLDIKEFWGIFLGNFGKFPGKFWNFPGIFRLVPRTKIDILNRQIKIFTVGLKENNSEIILNPPDQYLRKFNFHSFTQVLPTNTFT